MASSRVQLKNLCKGLRPEPQEQPGLRTLLYSVAGLCGSSMDRVFKLEADSGGEPWALKPAIIMGGLVSLCIQYQMISRIKGPLLKHFVPSSKVVN